MRDLNADCSGGTESGLVLNRDIVRIVEGFPGRQERDLSGEGWERFADAPNRRDDARSRFALCSN